jgi:hypothetical protein
LGAGRRGPFLSNGSAHAEERQDGEHDDDGADNPNDLVHGFSPFMSGPIPGFLIIDRANAARLAHAEERQYGENDDDGADNPDNAVHGVISFDGCGTVRFFNTGRPALVPLRFARIATFRPNRRTSPAAVAQCTHEKAAPENRSRSLRQVSAAN